MKAAPRQDERPHAPSAFELRAQALGRSPVAFVITSVLLLIPCFWQRRIQAGDLSSHIYNAWLAQLIESGKTTGLAVVHQTTNVLFDILLAVLLRAFGASAAQRIAVALCVLVFAWGAFAFISRIAGRRAWGLLPAVAILAYGWTFHMGFLNFYLSLGLCFFALAVGWKPNPRSIAAAVALLAAAYAAHGLAVAWAAALLAYRWLALRLDPRLLPRFAAAALAAIVALRLLLSAFMATRWSAQQLFSIAAADQAWVYGGKYRAVVVALLVVWAVLFVRLLHVMGRRKLLASVPFHFSVLTAAGICLLPNVIAIPGYRHNLVFIAERMSLALGICYCALLAGVRAPAFARYGLLAITLLFFGFLYRDDAILNAFEDRIEAAVAPLREQRVVTGIDDPNLRATPFTHMVDRACLGVCYSYANYEPSTAQFRVRALAVNPFVASTYEESWLLQTGNYIVQPRDLPLYRVDLDPAGRIVARALPAGAPNGMAVWNLLE